MKKRPGTMSDDERALEHLKHRTPAAGVPVSEFAPSKNDFTPVTEVIERIERTIVLDPRDRLIIQLFWEHTANMTLRWEQTDAAKLDARIDKLERADVELRGDRGDNGKVGTLKERLDKLESRRWQVVMWAAGLLVAIIGASITFGRWMSAVETDVEWLKERAQQRVRHHVSPPDFPATKEGNTP